MKFKSFDQKAAAYWAIIRANPDTPASTIYKRYKGTPMGMRKQDSLSLTKQLKDANEFRIRSENSSMFKETRKRVNRGLYKAAKDQSIYGLKRKPQDPKVRHRTIRQTIFDVFGGAEIEEYVEFY